MINPDLSIREELFLLTLHEKKSGSLAVDISKKLQIGLASAFLIDLITANVVYVSETKKIRISEEIATDQLMMGKVKYSEIKYKSICHCVKLIIHAEKNPYKHLMNSLLQKEIVKVESKRFLWNKILNETTSQSSSYKFLRKSELRNIIMNEAETQERDIALLVLISALRLAKYILTLDEIKFGSQRIENLLLHAHAQYPALQKIMAVTKERITK